MVSDSLSSPPAENHKSTRLRKSTLSSAKSMKSLRRTPKPASSRAAMPHHGHITQTTSMDARHKRVWKACERCRMKKTKCDSEFPCKRCKEDGLVCIAGVRKKVGYKQLPRGYAEVLENIQYALITTVHKLYYMVRNNQAWGLGEPELNDRGQPVLHNIVQELGFIRPNSDIDLPEHSLFPEDEDRMAGLARQLEDQQKENEPQTESIKDTKSSVCNRTEREPSPELDHSDIEHNYRKAASDKANAMTLSSQSFTGSADFNFDPAPPEINTSSLLPSRSLVMSDFLAWPIAMRQYSDLTLQSLQQRDGMMANMHLLNQGIVASEFGAIKPQAEICPNPRIMLGMGEPIIYSGYDSESMRL